MNLCTPDKGNICVAHICGTRQLKSQTAIHHSNMEILCICV